MFKSEGAMGRSVRVGAFQVSPVYLFRVPAISCVCAAVILFATFGLLRLAEAKPAEPTKAAAKRTHHDYSAMLKFYSEKNLRLPTEEEIQKLKLPWPKVPPQENAAFYFAKAASLVKRKGIPRGSWLSRSVPYEGDQAAFHRWIDRNRPALHALREGLRKEACQYPIWIDKKTGRLTPNLADLSRLRSLARTCCDAGFGEELKGRPDAAADWYLACIRTGPKTRQDPMMIASLVGIAQCAPGESELERLLASAVLSERSLQRVIAICREAESSTDEKLRTWACETAYAQAIASSSPKIFNLFTHPFYKKAQKYYALVNEVLVKYNGQLLQQKVVDDLFANDLKDYKGRKTSGLTPFLPWVRELGRLNVRLRATQIRAGIALYQKRHSRLPANLKALCPDILPEVPMDPFSGKPIRYARKGDGWKVWSVDHDNVDNGGVSLPDRRWRSPDLVFPSKLPSNIEYRSSWGRKRISRGEKSSRAKTVKPAEALNKPIRVSFVDTPLQDACKFLRTLCKVDLRLFPKDVALQEKPHLITATLNDVPLWLALKVFAKCARPEADLCLRGKVVYIAAEVGPGDKRIVAPKGYREKARARLDAILKKKVNLSFEQTPLRDVMDFLRTLGGRELNVILLLRIARPSPVTLKLEDVSLRQAIEEAVKKAGVAVDYDLFPGIVTIVPKKTDEKAKPGKTAGENKAHETFRTYDVRDILAAVGGVVDDDGKVSPEEHGAELISLIVTLTGPENWRSVKYLSEKGSSGKADAHIRRILGGIPEARRNGQRRPAQGSLILRQGDLLVKQSARIHAEIEEILVAVREQMTTKVKLAVTFIAFTDDFVWKDINTNPKAPKKALKIRRILTKLISPRPREQRAWSGSSELMQQSDVRFLLSAVEKSAHARILKEASVTQLNSQKVDLRGAGLRPALPHALAKDARSVPTRALIRPYVSADRRYVTLFVGPGDRSVTFGKGTGPVVPDRGTVALGTTASGRDHVIILVTPTILIRDEVEARIPP